MAKISERLESAIKIRGILQSELAERTKIGRSSICTYVKGEYEPKQRNLYKLAKALDVNVGWLMGLDVPMGHFEPNTAAPIPEGFEPVHKVRMPMLGTIAAGEPIFAEEEYDEYIMADDDYHADFALRIAGDSMEGAGINDGDVVLIHKQDDVNDGQIAAVIIDDSATLKRVYHAKDHVTLVAENPKYAPMVFGRDGETVRIIGLAVACISKLN